MSYDNITIGKFIIDNLTTGMYNDPFCIYREYIQNAADAIDKDAYNENRDVHKDYEIRIKLDPQKQLITIEDNGCGVPVAQAAKTLLSLGDSTKVSDRERGFRGIGRLGGVAYCDTLLFTTKAKGESDETRITWDCREVQRLLNRHNDCSRHLEAKDLIAQCVTVKSQKSIKGIKESFFRVEMIGVKSVKDKLLDLPRVKSYLEEVAPIPFHTHNFHFGKQIDAWLRKEVADYQTYRIFLDDSLLTKRYCLTLPIHSKQPDELTGYEKIDIQDRQGKVIARGWLGVRKDNIGTVLPSSGIDSLRVRAGNILVGDAALLDPCFGGGTNDRFNGYLVGEIHITARDLVLNGRRDDFQDSEMKTDFLRGVEKIILPLTKEIRKDSERKNSVKPIETAKQTRITVQKQLESGFVGDAALRSAASDLGTGIQGLTEFQKKRNVPDAVKEKAEAESEKMQTLLDTVKNAKPSIDGALEGTVFSKKEREAIRIALEAVYELYEKTSDQNDLVNRVLQKLKRTHR